MSIIDNNMKKERIVYYEDELNDDFAGNGIKRKPVKNTFKYEHRSWVYRANSFLVKYLIAVPMLWIANTFIFRTKIENKHVLKYFKKKGYYLYSNHVLPFDPVVLPMKTHLKKKTIIVAGQELFSINGFVSGFVKHMDAIPIPNHDVEMMEKFVNYLSSSVKRGNRVLIFPEAHIWPYYNDIRHFKSVSFKYPVDDNAPIFTATTTFKKRKGCRKPKPIIYIDGPFFPDETLPYRERVNDLAERAYETMCYRAHNENNFAYIQYKKKDE